MPRRKEVMVGKGIPREEALHLAQRVFKLQETLGISHEQMAKECGFKGKNTIYNLRGAWYLGKSKREDKEMKPSMANGLKKFWNLHLINNGCTKEAEKNPPSPKPKKVIKPAQKISSEALKALIAKVGMDEAAKLLAERGKADVLNGFIESLSPEELADLV